MPKRKPNPSPTEIPTLSLKEKLAAKRKAAQTRKQVINTLSVAAAIAIVAGLLMAIVGGIKGGIGGGVAVFILMASFQYPWQALYAFLFYMPFSGTVTYSIGGNNPLFQLAKDGFYIPALIAVIQYCKLHKQPFLMPKALKPALGIFLAYCILVLLFVNGAQRSV